MFVLRYCCFRWLIYDWAFVFEPSRPLDCNMMLIWLMLFVELCCHIIPWVPDLDRTRLRVWLVYSWIGGVTRSRLIFRGFYIYRNFWRWSHVKEVPEASTRQAHAPGGGGRAPHPRGRPGIVLAQLFYSWVFFWSIKNRQNLAHQLDSVWYSFSVKLKNKEKNRNWHWALG